MITIVPIGSRSTEGDPAGWELRITYRDGKHRALATVASVPGEDLSQLLKRAGAAVGRGRPIASGRIDS